MKYLNLNDYLMEEWLTPFPLGCQWLIVNSLTGPKWPISGQIVAKLVVNHCFNYSPAQGRRCSLGVQSVLEVQVASPAHNSVIMA